MLKIIIPTADDSNITLNTEIGYEYYIIDYGVRTNDSTVHIQLGKGLDAIHNGLCEWWEQNLKRRFSSRGRIESLDITISGYSITVTKNKNYKVNGLSQSLANICHILSRLTYTSVNDKDRLSIRNKFMMYCKTPNDVIYALENRTPYHWYELGRKTDVRLNTRKISDVEVALEISDGIWGSISMKDLNSFLGFYLHGKKQTKWKHCSPSLLYEKLIGVPPSESQLKLMLAFLSQNRTEKLVEERAKQLLVSMSKQYSDRMLMTTVNELIHIRVKGKDHQWLLVERKNSRSADRQKVSVYILGTEKVTEFGDIEYNMGLLNEGEHTFRERTTIKCSWRGPICIDNLASGSSLGDQFASRILAVMNDNMTISRVSTLNHYTKNDYSMPNLSLEDGMDTDYEFKMPHSYKEYFISIANVIEEEFK